MKVTDSPMSSSTSWRSHLHSIKNSFLLGTPRFHRRKMDGRRILIGYCTMSFYVIGWEIELVITDWLLCIAPQREDSTTSTGSSGSTNE